MKESDLITQFSRDLTEYRQSHKLSFHYWHKLADVPLNSMAATLRSVLCPGCLARAQARTGLFRYQGGKNPFDVLCVIDGIPLAMEFKWHKDHTAVPLEMVKDHQIESLRQFHDAFGIALVMVGVNCEREKIGWRVPPEWEYRGRIEFLAMIPVKRWLWLLAEMRRLKRKSIPLEYFWQREISWPSNRWLCGRVTGDRGSRQWDIAGFEQTVEKLAKEECEEVGA